MTNRDMHAEVMRTLEGMRTKMDGVESLAKENREHLQRISPKRTVQPVTRPRQGTQLVRGASVTACLRQYTRDKNSRIPEGQPRYEEFSEDITDKQYNTGAMNALEWILGMHLGSDIGVLTWEQVCKKSAGKMGLIVRDATNAPELGVFAQAAVQWAIQMLITNKMNSRIRYNRDKRGKEEAENEELNLAPMTVPDIEPEEDLPEINSSMEHAPLQEVYQEAASIERGTEHQFPIERAGVGMHSSYHGEGKHDEGLYRHSVRRSTQQRRILPIGERNSQSTGEMVQANASYGLTNLGVRNRAPHTVGVRGSSWRGVRARGRGVRVSRAASNATARVISRRARAPRGSAVTNRRGSRI